MQIGFNPHLTPFFFSILIWPYRPWISIWPYRPWIWHLSPGRPGSERGKVQGFVQPASSIHDSSSRDLWSANVLLHWQTMMLSKTGFSTTTRGQRGWFKTSLGELNGTSYLKTSQQNLRVWKKQWLLKDPPVLSGGEVVPSEQFTKPSFSIHVHCATSGKERYSGADGWNNGMSDHYEI